MIPLPRARAAGAPAYDAALGELVDTVVAGVRHPMLYNDGLAGFGWALAHVLDGDDDGLLATIDGALLRVVSVDRWTGDFDLAQGLVGHGVYFRERGAAGAAGLARVVGHLAACADRGAGTACWRTTAAMLPAFHRERWPDGYYDCGMAHGTAGVIALLSRAGAGELCTEATRWLVARGREGAETGLFPAIASEGASRAAWCYGDPGVAIALWHANPTTARATALACARRSAETCGADELGLCHGTAGLAHLFARVCHATSDAELYAAARRWYATTLERYRARGLAVFEQRIATKTGDDRYRIVTGLLDGTIGFALALIAGATASEPCWDRFDSCSAICRSSTLLSSVECDLSIWRTTASRRYQSLRAIRVGATPACPPRWEQRHVAFAMKHAIRGKVS